MSPLNLFPNAALLALIITASLGISGCSSTPRAVIFGLTIQSTENENPLEIVAIDYKTGEHSIISREYPQGRLSANFGGRYSIGDSISVTWRTNNIDTKFSEKIPLQNLSPELLTDSQLVVWFSGDKPHTYLVKGQHDDKVSRIDSVVRCKTINHFTPSNNVDERIRNMYCRKVVTKLHPNYIQEVK